MAVIGFMAGLWAGTVVGVVSMGIAAHWATRSMRAEMEGLDTENVRLQLECMKQTSLAKMYRKQFYELRTGMTVSTLHGLRHDDAFAERRPGKPQMQDLSDMLEYVRGGR